MNGFDIKAAIAERNGRPGIIRLPEGEHQVSQTIQLAAGQALVGERRGTAIVSSASPAIAVATECEVVDLNLRSTIYSPHTIGILIVPKSSRWSVENVQISGFGDGIYTEDAYVGVLNQVCAVMNRNGIRIGGGSQTTTRIRDCYLGANYEWGFNLAGMLNMSITIDGCTFEGNRRGGASLSGDCRQLSVSNCHFEQSGELMPAYNNWGAGFDLQVFGNIYALTIFGNVFTLTLQNLNIVSAHAGEVFRNYFGSKTPLVIGGAASGLVVRDNDMPFAK